MSVFSIVTITTFVILFALTHYKEKLQCLLRRLTPKSLSKHTSPSDVKSLAPYPVQAIKGRERYRVMMDIRKQDAQNWLTIDKNYTTENRVRAQLIDENREKVIRCLPESLESCQETLDEVSAFLCERFPDRFSVITQDNKKVIENNITGDRLTISGDTPEERAMALETAVRLTMEDLSVLMTNEEGEYYL